MVLLANCSTNYSTCSCCPCSFVNVGMYGPGLALLPECRPSYSSMNTGMYGLGLTLLPICPWDMPPPRLPSDLGTFSGLYLISSWVPLEPPASLFPYVSRSFPQWVTSIRRSVIRDWFSFIFCRFSSTFFKVLEFRPVPFCWFPDTHPSVGPMCFPGS